MHAREMSINQNTQPRVMLIQTDHYHNWAGMQVDGTAQCSIWVAKISGQGLDELPPESLD